MKENNLEQTTINMLETFRGIVTSSPVGMCVTDSNGLFVIVNQALCELIQRKEKDLVGTHFSDIFRAEERDDYKRNYRKRFLDAQNGIYPKGHPEGTLRHELNGKKGERITVEGTMACLFSERRVTHILTTVVDITAKSNVEEKVRKREDYYHSLLEHIQDVIMVVNDDSTIRYLAPSIKKSFGYDPLEPVGKSSFDYVHPEDQPAAIHAFVKALANPGELVKADVRMRHKNGDYTLMAGVGSFAVEADGDKYIVVNGRDITDLKRKEAELRKNEALFRGIFRDSPIGIAALDAEGLLIEANEAFHALLGDADRPLSPSASLFDGPFLSPEQRCELRGGESLRFENISDTDIINKTSLFSFNKPRGMWLDIRITAMPGVNSGGAQMHLIQAQDVTLRVNSEQALRSEHNRLRAILDTMPDGVCIVNRDFEIEYANPVLTREFGDSFHNSKCHEYFEGRKEPCPQCSEANFTAINTRREWHSKKNNRVYDLFDTPIQSIDGRQAKLQIFHDITSSKLTKMELVESEERYRTLFETSPDAIFIVGLDGQIIDMNSAACRFAETPADRLVGSPFFRIDTIEPDTMKEYIALFERLKSGEPIGNIEISFKRDNGEIFWGEASVSRLKKDGHDYAFQVIARDVTERKAAQKALAESEERYRNLFETSPETIYIVGVDGKVIDMNRPTSRITELGQENIVGKLFSNIDRVGDRTQEKCAEAFKKLVAGEKVDSFELEFDVGDGIKRWGEVSASALSRDGEPYAIQVVSRDITDRKNAQKALAKSEERYRTLAESAQDFIFIIDHDDIVQYVNSFGAAQLGREPEDMIGKPRSAFFPPDVSNRMRDNIQTVLAEGKTLSIETATPFEGSEKWLDTVLAPLRDTDGNVSAVLGISRDATERKRLEQSKINFLSSISHELRTPLSLILGNAELLLRENLPPGVMTKLKIIHDRGKQELRLVEELLDLATFRTGGTTFNIQNTRIVDFLKDYVLDARDIIAGMVEQRYRGAGYDFQSHIDETLQDAHIRVDEKRIRQALDNLVENSVKYSMPGDISIRISAERVGEMIRVSVHDSGIGVPESEIEHIFLPLYQVRKGEHPISDGIGKGLCIVREYVEAHGGRVRVESTPGKGSSFHIELPESEAPAAAVQKEQTKKCEVSSLKILVADDNADMGMLIGDLLESTGFSVRIATHKREIDAALAEEIPDIILLDVNMPGTTGPEIFRNIKRDARCDDCRIYLFSAKSAGELRDLAEQLGADGFISKPFVISEFMDTISNGQKR